jgi:hypothetical protein
LSPEFVPAESLRRIEDVALISSLKEVAVPICVNYRLHRIDVFLEDDECHCSTPCRSPSWYINAWGPVTMKRPNLKRNMQTRKRKPKSSVAEPSKESQTPKRMRLLDEYELQFYARSFHKAAQALAGSLLVGGNPVSDVDFSPVLNTYRQALELHLKAIVLGDGGSFLETKPDVISVHKTHSVSWLAQFVAQIITALKWEMEFRCEGVENLDGFKAVVEELNAVDPGSYTYRCFVDSEARFDVAEFCRKMDALLGLLDSTADGLAAEWDLRSGVAAIDDDWNGSRSERTIQ